MISEISNFIEQIDESYFTEGLKPAEGLHIWIKLDDNGNAEEMNHWQIKKNSNPEKIPKYYEFGIRDYYSNWLSNNKTMDIGGVGKKMQILSANPFTIFFTKSSLDNGQIFLKIPVYYDNLLNLKTYNEKLKFSDDELNRIILIKNFLINNLKEKLNEIPLIKNLQNKDKLKIYFDENIESVKKAYERYLTNKLFLVDDDKLNITVKENEKEFKYGIIEFLTTLGKAKKPFLIHQTTNFKIINRFETTYHRNAFKFRKLLENKKLPNPLPIFIDKDELLNSRVVELYNREGVLNFHQIIRKLIEEHKRDLSNYYLIFWSRAGGISIKDLDFVPLFKFKLDDFTIKTYFSKEVSEIIIDNVFDFEINIVQKIFNNILVQRNKDESYSYKYFDDIEYNSKYMTKTTHINVLKYRKAFYDFIYKSKQNSITKDLFNNLLISGIIDDIRHDEFKNNAHTKELNIKDKLNIYFSLIKNFGGENMGSKIQPLQEKLKKLLTESDNHIESDEEFAFDSGQLVYYIVYQSEAANKTHALIEPYISKNDPELFKTAIARGIEQYKHKLPFGTKKFQKLASEVLGWETKTKIKEVLPLFLAGYFSNSQLFESTKN